MFDRHEDKTRGVHKKYTPLNKMREPGVFKGGNVKETSRELDVIVCQSLDINAMLKLILIFRCQK